MIDRATRLHCDSHPYSVSLEESGDIRARAIVIASGVCYRKADLENLERFEGDGIYYGATRVEAQLCAGDEAIVVGGGNSAGQAAVFLSKFAARVYVLVRSGTLADSMRVTSAGASRRRRTSKLLLHTEIVALARRRSAGNRSLEKQRNRGDGRNAPFSTSS